MLHKGCQSLISIARWRIYCINLMMIIWLFLLLFINVHRVFFICCIHGTMQKVTKYDIDTYLMNYLLFLHGNSILPHYYSCHIGYYLYVIFNDECIKSFELSPGLKVILLLKSQNVGVICHILESSKLLPSMKVILLWKS